jgi:hypothetical protein
MIIEEAVRAVRPLKKGAKKKGKPQLAFASSLFSFWT